jgi:hypothetical protein
MRREISELFLCESLCRLRDLCEPESLQFTKSTIDHGD